MPNSVLWVCLVAVWLFVLVPMVIKGRPQMSKTTDAAKATRLLHRGGIKARSTSRRARGSHPHDPSYQRSERKRASVVATESAEPTTATARTAPTSTLLKDRDDDLADSDVDSDADVESDAAEKVDTAKVDTAKVDAAKVDVRRADGSGVAGPAADDSTDEADVDDDYTDDEVTVTAEIVDPESDSDTSDLGDIVDAEVGEVVEEPEELDDEFDDDLEDDIDDDIDDYSDPEVDEFENPRAARGDREHDELDDEYDLDDDYDDDLDDEYDDDLDDEYDVDDDESADHDDIEEGSTQGARPQRRRRGAYTPDKRQIELKYRERQRVTIGLLILMLAGIASGVVLGTLGWVIAGVTAAMFVFYLGYLRRAVAVEQQIRAQRMARAKRHARQDAERRRRTQSMEEFATAPPAPRMRRPGGATVLEIDDEDPVFDHLPPFQRRRMMREDPEFRQVG